MTISNKRLTWVLLAAVLAVALFLRLWRLDFGMELPYLAHTDEPTQYNPAIQMITTGDLNPHFFNYPSLTIYLNAAVICVVFGIGRLVGTYTSLADLQPIRFLQMSVGLVGTPSMLLVGRAVTAVFGTLTVGLLFALVRRFTQRAWGALLAALLLAISLSHVQLSHYMTVDVIATAFVTAALVACAEALVRDDGARAQRWLWAAAVCGGLATSCKYNYAVLSVSVGLAGLLMAGTLRERIRRVIVSGVLFCSAFALTSPFVLLDAGAAFPAIRSEMRHYATGHLGVTGSSFLWYLGYLWKINPFYLLLGIPGLGLALWRMRRLAVPPVVFVIAYFALIGEQAVHFDRNVLPVLVFLIAGVGVTVGVLVDAVVARPGRRSQPLLILFSLILLSLIPLLPSLAMLPPVLQSSKPSGRAQAQAWFDQRLVTPEDCRALDALKVVAESYTVYVDPDCCDVEYMATITTLSTDLDYFQRHGYDVVIVGSGMFNRFYETPDVYAKEAGLYNALFAHVPYLAFENAYDPLEFRENGARVYVFLLTEQAQQWAGND
jgi:4-amino-4-deoxy-L-arabinose transferase-like glycosyltransferase